MDSQVKGFISKLKVKGGEDRISSFPDAIITRILSLLPTRYAVMTSVLSSRWKNHWTTIDSFDFDDVTLCLGTELKYSEGFPRFVRRVLEQCDAINIHKFRLCYHALEDLAFLHDCVLFAVSRNVQELELSLRFGQVWELPCEPFTCRSLTKLKVETDYLFDVPPLTDTFPNLKSLHIQFKYHDLNFCQNLLRHCPQLEDLLIDAGSHYWEQLCDRISGRNIQTSIDLALDNMLLSPLSCFPYLARLEITIDNFFVRLLLPIFLRASPNLKVLILHMASFNQEHKEEGRRVSQPFNWMQWVHDEVPFCLLQQLRVLRIKSFRYQFVEKDVVKYLLDSAAVLQKITIHVLEPNIKEKVSKWILKLPRVSNTCQVEIV